MQMCTHTHDQDNPVLSFGFFLLDFLAHFRLVTRRRASCRPQNRHTKLCFGNSHTSYWRKNIAMPALEITYTIYTDTSIICHRGCCRSDVILAPSDNASIHTWSVTRHPCLLLTSILLSCFSKSCIVCELRVMSATIASSHSGSAITKHIWDITGAGAYAYRELGLRQNVLCAHAHILLSHGYMYTYTCACPLSIEHRMLVCTTQPPWKCYPPYPAHLPPLTAHLPSPPLIPHAPWLSLTTAHTSPATSAPPSPSRPASAWVAS